MASDAQKGIIDRLYGAVEPYVIAVAFNAFTWGTAFLARINPNAAILAIAVIGVASIAFIVYWYRQNESWREQVGKAALIALAVWGAIIAVEPKGFIERFHAGEIAADSLHTLRDSLIAHPESAVRKADTRLAPSGPRVGSWPLAYQPPVNQHTMFAIHSYKGPCDGLPPGRMCFKFDDGYVALIADTLSGERGWSGSGTTKVEKIGGNYADYYHLLGSSTLDVVRTWNQKDRPRSGPR